MVHTVGQHDPKPEPVKLHADDADAIVGLHGKVDWLCDQLRDLHAKIDRFLESPPPEPPKKAKS